MSTENTQYVGAAGVSEWREESLCMVLDIVTGEPVRFGFHQNAIGTLKAAKERIACSSAGWATRYVIVGLNAMRLVKLNGVDVTPYEL